MERRTFLKLLSASSVLVLVVMATVSCSLLAESKLTTAKDYYNRGVMWWEKEKWDEAIKDFNKAIELRSDYAPAYFLRGGTWESKERWDKAIKDYSKLIELDPDDAGAYLLRGLARASNRQWQKALANAEKAIDLAEKQKDNATLQTARTLKTKVKIRMNLTAESKIRTAQGYLQRGLMWTGRREWDAAIKNFNKAVESKSHIDFIATAYFLRGRAWSGQREWDEAIKDANKAIELDPDFSDAYYDRGKAWAGKEKWRKALADVEKAIELAKKQKHTTLIRDAKKLKAVIEQAMKK